MNSKKPFDQALELFMDCFIERHPRASWPEWFWTSTTYGGTLVDNHIWKFSFSAYPKSSLSPNEAWEETESGYSLVVTDPRTGEKKYVISSSPSEIVNLFEVMIDVGKMKANVVSDQMDVNFDRMDFLPLRKK